MQHMWDQKWISTTSRFQICLNVRKPYFPELNISTTNNKNLGTKSFAFQINSTQYVDFMMTFVLIKQNHYLWAM